MKYLLFYILFVLSFSLSGENADTILVEKLNQRAGRIVWDSSQTSLLLSNKALDISQKIDYMPGVASASNNLGIVYHKWGAYDKSLEYF
ncbi:MAG: hypothetical protein C0594_01500 [Marinilabiliales bacterium]|nr:MAG: hypothetical protein C0594_01500 [Marinilabiliales bacterium]